MSCQKCFQFWSDEVGKFWIKQSQACFLRVGMGGEWGRGASRGGGGEASTAFCRAFNAILLKIIHWDAFQVHRRISKIPVWVCMCWRIRLLPLWPPVLSLLSLLNWHYGHCSLVHAHYYLKASPLALPVAWKSQVSAQMELLHRGLPRSTYTESQPPSRHSGSFPWFVFLLSPSISYVCVLCLLVYYLPHPLPPPLGCALYEELQAFRGLLEMPGAWYYLLVGDQANGEKKMYASGLHQL